MIKDLYNNFNDSYDKLINVLDDIIAKKIEYNIDDLSSYIHKFDDVTIINKIGLAICSYGKNAEHIILKLLDSKSESVVLSMLSGIKHYHDIIPATIFEKISILLPYVNLSEYRIKFLDAIRSSNTVSIQVVKNLVNFVESLTNFDIQEIDTDSFMSKDPLTLMKLIFDFVSDIFYNKKISTFFITKLVEYIKIPDDYIINKVSFNVVFGKSTHFYIIYLRLLQKYINNCNQPLIFLELIYNKLSDEIVNLRGSKYRDYYKKLITLSLLLNHYDVPLKLIYTDDSENNYKELIEEIELYLNLFIRRN